MWPGMIERSNESMLPRWTKNPMPNIIQILNEQDFAEREVFVSSFKPGN